MTSMKPIAWTDVSIHSSLRMLGLPPGASGSELRSE